MSMKFFTGLQDLLGLYTGESGSNGGSGGNSPASSPSAAIPPSSPLYSPVSQTQRKKGLHELNANYHSEEAIPVQKCSHTRTVHFPDVDEELISGYSEAPQSPFQKKEGDSPESEVVNAEELLTNYKRACIRLGTTPSTSLEKQIGYFHRVASVRQEGITLKGERVSHSQMEAMEEIFRKVQFDQLDFEYTFLDDDTVIALSEMLEFYDSTHKLNLSFNKQITLRGWNAIFKAVRKCCSLQMLNLRYTSLSEKALPALCRTLRTQPQPTLSCLHLENVNLAGKNLLLVVCALKTNTTLKELYLGENSLQATDGAHLYQLIVSNSTITTLDLRNNQLQDGGVRHICDALRSVETCRRSSLQALVLWNNRMTAACMDSIAAALKVNHRLETLNVGSNPLGEAGISNLKSALLQQDSSLHRLGLQSTNMNNQSAIMLAECLADNTSMVRIDLRDNPSIGSAGLLALHSAMKINRYITLLNLDHSLATPSSAKVRPYQEEFRKYYDEIKSFCDRNKMAALEYISASVEMERVSYDECEQGTVKDEETQTEAEALNTVEEENVECSTSGDSKRLINKFARSASLTCSETIPDVTIQERLREMSGSTHSLDEVSNVDSMKTIKKGSMLSISSVTNGPGTCTLQHKAEWGSLPSLSQSQPVTKPVVRKLRRFSVSPTSSAFDISGPKLKLNSDTMITTASRPTSLPVGIPLLSTEQHLSSSLPTVLQFPPTTSSKSSGLISPVHERTSSENICDEEAERVREQREKEEHGRRENEKKEREEAEQQLKEQLKIDNAQREADVRTVVNDLVNYVVYEDTSVVERKRSLLLQASTFNEPPDPIKLMGALQEFTTETPTTPSRMISIAEELFSETDEEVVTSVMRNLVRHVLRKEKDELRNTLDRRRYRILKDRSSPTSGPSTPV